MKRVVLALALLWPLSGHAADQSDKPSASFCAAAKAHRALFSTDRAAEDAARALGASEATIAKAKRCPR